MYLRSKICGGDDEEMFTDIQLDEIRLERVSNKERTILGRIDQMKVPSSPPNRCSVNAYFLAKAQRYPKEKNNN
jgi:hypothetical protein